MALMSPRIALKDWTTAGVCNGMYLTMHVGKLSLNAPWIIPTSSLLTVTGAPESPGWPQTCITMVPGVWPAPGDAARIAGGAALFAGDLTEGRVRTDAADQKPLKFATGVTLAGSNLITA